VTKHNDRHLTTEELSTLLDGQLSEQEQATCEAHLETCQQCRLVLAELRQTVSLLHALPQPELPRSFVLPTNVSYIQEHRDTAANTGTSANLAPVQTPGEQERRRQRARTFTLRRSTRILSLIAAVIGLFILAPGVFAILPRFTNNASSTSGSAGPSTVSAPQSNTNNNTHNPTIGTSHATPSATAQKTNAPGIAGIGTVGPHTTPTTVPTPTPTKDTNTQPGPLPLPNLSTPLGQQEIGFTLLVLGIIGLLLTRGRRNEKVM
jgi:hypothetical protein